MDADDAVPGAAAPARASTRTDVRTVVMTHLHSDHASGIAEFPGATFVAQLGRSGTPRRRAASRTATSSASSTTPSTTARSTSRAPTPTRSPASAARLRPVRRRQRPHGLHPRPHPRALLGGAAADGPRGADRGRRRLHDEDDRGDAHLPFKMADEHRFRRSLKEIQLYIEQTPGRRGHPGPRHAAWRRLDSVITVPHPAAPLRSRRHPGALTASLRLALRAR